MLIDDLVKPSSSSKHNNIKLSMTNATAITLCIHVLVFTALCHKTQSMLFINSCFYFNKKY